jgi:uncharacterized protein (DUF58 family)
VTFHALREYVPGDDLRHIHWRATARVGTLMVRELVDVSLPRTTVILDARPASYQPGGEAAGTPTALGEDGSELFEAAVDAAASVAVAAARHGFPVRVLTTAGTLLEAKGDPGAAVTLLDWFATVTATASGSLAGPLTTARGRGEGSLVVVTGSMGRAETGLIAAARSRFEHTVLIRLAADPEPAGGPPGVTVIDAADPPGVSAGWRRAGTR